MAENIFGLEDTGQIAEGDFLSKTFGEEPLEGLEKIDGKKTTSGAQTTKPPTTSGDQTTKAPEKVVVPDAADVLNDAFGEGKPDGGNDGEKKDVTLDKKVDDDDSEDNQFQALSKELYSLNIFQSGVDDDGNEVQETASTPEEFKQLFEDQANSKVGDLLEDFLTRFGEDKRDLFNAVFVNGVDPAKYFQISNQLEKMEGLDLTNEANQEKVVREFYKRNGMPEEKIGPKIQRLKDIAELQSEAEGYHPILLEQDKATLANEDLSAKQKIAYEERNDKLYQQSITKILVDKIKEKDFDGIAVNDKVANEAFQFLYEKTYKDKTTGKKLTEFDIWVRNLERPENHALKVKIALLAKSNFDLSKVKQKAITTETNKLFSSLEKKQIRKTKITEPEDNSGWAQVLK